MLTRRGGSGLRWTFVVLVLCSLLVVSPQSADAAEGAAWAWGDNAYGALGVGDTSERTTPTAIPALPSDVVQIAGGLSFSMALLSDGTVWSWGANYFGQLGQGNDDEDIFEPGQVVGPTGGDPFLTNIKTISSGHGFSLALDDVGTVYAWGSGYDGQLGNNSTADSNRPLVVAGLPEIADISTGVSHALALSSAGAVYVWGRNDYGQLGLGDSEEHELIPVKLTAFEDQEIAIANVASGMYRSFAITDDGDLYEWGLGMTTVSGEPYIRTPRQVTGISHVVDADAGTNHSIALTASGDVYGWGDRRFAGVPGDGDYVLVPGLVMSGVRMIAAGTAHNLALTTDRTIYAWGFNRAGRLGDGTTTDRALPTFIPSPPDVTFGAIAAGALHSFAIEQGITPPTTTATVNDLPPDAGWYQSATVTLTADDPAATTTYEIGTGSTQTYSGSFSLTPDGTYTITFRSVDPFSNVEADQSITVRVDGTAPTLQPIANQTLDALSVLGAPVSFSVVASDNLTATGDLVIGCRDQGNTPFASGDIAPFGVTTITCTATDLAGNTASTSFTATVRGVDGAFDVLRAQLRELGLPRIMQMSLLAQVQMAERMADAEREQFSCLQLRVVDLTVRLLEWVRLVPANNAGEIRSQIALIQAVLGCGQPLTR